MKNYKVCIVGLGNVGLDLAKTFSKKYCTVGFDKNNSVVTKIRKNLNTGNKINSSLFVTNKELEIADSNIYIVAVPSGIKKNKTPELKNILNATKTIANFIKRNDIIIYESTVYPGLTEQLCIPLLESLTGFKLNTDFFVGYSPERINIGDDEKKTSEIIKVTSGSNASSRKKIDDLYKSVIEAGTFSAESIKIAEASKILENCQRDLNIALINEMSLLFKKLKIDTIKVIEAAATKWNFMPYYPGLVGGECIAVDPYYIIHQAKNLNCRLNLAETAREINIKMVKYVFEELNKKLKKIQPKKVAFFGIAYKQDCDQIKNSMYLKIVKKLEKRFPLEVYDHLINNTSQLKLKKEKDLCSLKYDAIIIGAKHKKYKNMNFEKYTMKPSNIIDIHGINYSSFRKIL